MLTAATKKISAIVAWGSLWGITEATVGHLLHVFASPYGWLFWYPLAFFFLHRVYRATDDAGACLGAAGIAAGLKFVDLLLPVRLDFVVNPAVSILLEGLVVGAAFGLLRRLNRQVLPGPAGVLLLSAAWRGLYLLYALWLMPAAWRALSPLSGTAPLLRFALLESAANTVCIWVYSRLAAASAAARPKSARAGLTWHPAVTGLLLGLAVLITWRF